MRCRRRVTRLLAALGMVTIGFASVAQAAGTDRKAYRAARESRVTKAETGRATPEQRTGAEASVDRSGITSRGFWQRHSIH